MIRVLAVSHWADTGSTSLEAAVPEWARAEDATETPVPSMAPQAEHLPYRRRSPRLAPSRSILKAIAACTPGGQVRVKAPAISLTSAGS